MKKPKYIPEFKDIPTPRHKMPELEVEERQGNFIEVEGTLSRINHALALLSLADAHRIRASYVDLFERVRAVQGLAFRDLTFANFAAITVPLHLFGSGVES